LDLLIKRSSNRHLLPAVYRKPTYLDWYLNFRRASYNKNNQWLTLLSNWLKHFTPQPRIWTAKWSTWNGLSSEFLSQMNNLKQKKRNNTTDFLGLCLKLFYRTQLTWESLKRILEKHRKRTNFKPTTKPSKILSLGEDIVSASKCQGVVCEIPCGECEHKYIGETKRSLSTRLKEYQRNNLPKNPKKQL